MKRHWVALTFAVPLLAQPPTVFREDVNLVRVPCTVRDSNGAAAHDLRSDEFVVLDDGVPQQVKYIWQESDLPLTVGLIADCSCSQSSFLSQQRQTLMQFVSRILSPQDRAFLVSVAEQQKLVTDLTSSVESLRAGTEGLGIEEAAVLGEPCSGENPTVWSRHSPPCGGKTLWNGVFFAAKLKLRPQAGRKAMLLLTDGWDTGSDRGVTDAIEACQGADTVVFSIRYNPYKFSLPALTRGQHDLQRIARETGGLAFEGESDKLPAIFDRIEADLRSQYVLGYTPSAAQNPGSYHKIKVKVTRPGLAVRARQGYYAQ